VREYFDFGVIDLSLELLARVVGPLASFKSMGTLAREMRLEHFTLAHL